LSVSLILVKYAKFVELQDRNFSSIAHSLEERGSRRTGKVANLHLHLSVSASQLAIVRLQLKERSDDDENDDDREGRGEDEVEEGGRGEDDEEQPEIVQKHDNPKEFDSQMLDVWKKLHVGDETKEQQLPS